MAQYRNWQEEFDTAIIGTGLCSLILAETLGQRGQKVTLVETSSNIYGYLHEQTMADSLNAARLRYQPACDNINDLIEGLNQAIGTQIESEVVDNSVKTVDSGSLKDFLGFGDRKFSGMSVYGDLCRNTKLQSSTAMHEVLPSLADRFSGRFIPNARVTGFALDDGHATGLILNEDRILKANHFIYCDSPHKLPGLLGHEAFSSRVQSKLSRNKPMSALYLRLLLQEPMVEPDNFFVSMGAKDDFEPCLGESWINSQGEQVTNWAYLIPTEQAEDHETMVAAIKYMKRQIKRVYPELVEKSVQETITFGEDQFGSFDLTREQLSKGLPSNLFLSSPRLSNQISYWADIESALLTLDSLLPAEKPSEDDSHLASEPLS